MRELTFHSACGQTSEVEKILQRPQDPNMNLSSTLWGVPSYTLQDYMTLNMVLKSMYPTGVIPQQRMRLRGLQSVKQRRGDRGFGSGSR